MDHRTKIRNLVRWSTFNRVWLLKSDGTIWIMCGGEWRYACRIPKDQTVVQFARDIMTKNPNVTDVASFLPQVNVFPRSEGV